MPVMGLSVPGVQSAPHSMVGQLQGPWPVEAMVSQKVTLRGVFTCPKDDPLYRGGSLRDAWGPYIVINLPASLAM
jgi:hypothetical protein